jgi:ribosomal-protein-alanine N-acetyltransferase
MSPGRHHAPRIRAVEAFDLAMLAALHAACFEEAWSRDSLATLLATPGAFGLVAAGGAEPTGFLLARIATDEAEILSLGVRPPARRRGIGSCLLQAALERMARGGARRTFLEVAEDNVAALALYSAAGFTPVGRRPRYYRRCGTHPTAALVLSRPLDRA